MINKKFINYRVSRYEGGPLIDRVGPSHRSRALADGSVHDSKYQQDMFSEFQDSFRRVKNLWQPYGAQKIEGDPIRIVVAVDDSPVSFHALEMAAFLARHYHSRVFVANIVDEGFESVIGKHKQILFKRLKGACESIEWDIQVIPHHNVAQALTNFMVQENAHLLVMGTHGKKNVDLVQLGSVAEDVLRLAENPILVCSDHNIAPSLKKILVPVDGTKFAYPAIQQAVLLAKDFDSELVLFHASDVAKNDKSYQEFLGMLDQMEWQKIHHDMVEQEGEVVPAICLYAKIINADLVVMGTHLRDRFQKSVTVDVIRSIARPVWVVHP